MSISKPKAVRLIVGLILLASCCVVLSIAALGYYTFNSNTNVPMASDLVETLENTFVSDEQFMQEFINSLSQESNNIELNADFKGLSSDISSVVSTTMDGRNITVTLNGNLQANTTDSQISSKIEIDTSGLKMFTNIDAKTFIETNQTYIKLSNLPSFLTGFVEGLDAIDNQWILVPNNLTQESTPTLTDEEIMAQVKKVVELEEFKSMFTKSPDRVFGNVRAYCIDFNADKQKLEALLNEYDSKYNEDVAANLSELNNLKINGTFCFGRRDGLPYLVSLNSNIDGTTVTMELNNFDYSKQITIEKPESFINYNELNLGL